MESVVDNNINVLKPKNNKKKRKFKNLMKDLTQSNKDNKDNTITIKNNTGGGHFKKIDKI